MRDHVVSTAVGYGLIRDADPTRDARDCLDIYAPFITDTAVSFEERVPSLEEFQERMRASIETHPWLVYDDRGVKGYAYGSQFRTRAAYRWAADVSVYVAPGHHGRGVGRQLYTALFTRLRDQGFYVACATIALPNEASIGLHRAMGFEPVGVYRNVGWKLGAWQDVSWWQLQLRPPSDSPPAEPLPPSASRLAPD